METKSNPYSYSKNTFQLALNFQRHLDLSREKSKVGVKANLWLGYQYQAISKDYTDEQNKESLTSAANYYVAALNLAKELGLDDYLKAAADLLKNIGRDEKGEQLPELPPPPSLKLS